MFICFRSHLRQQRQLSQRHQQLPFQVAKQSPCSPGFHIGQVFLEKHSCCRSSHFSSFHIASQLALSLQHLLHSPRCKEIIQGDVIQAIASTKGLFWYRIKIVLIQYIYIYIYTFNYLTHRCPLTCSNVRSPMSSTSSNGSFERIVTIFAFFLFPIFGPRSISKLRLPSLPIRKFADTFFWFTCFESKVRRYDIIINLNATAF